MGRELHLAADREPPHIEHLSTFGCTAYMHKKGPNKPARSAKMEARAMKGLLVGYGSLHGHIYHVYVPDKKKVFRFSEAVAKTPVSNDSNYNVHFDDPDLLIHRPFTSNMTDASKEPIVNIEKQTSSGKNIESEPIHVDYMMSPPLEEVLQHESNTETASTVIHNTTQTSPEADAQDEYDEDSFQSTLEDEEADHRDPAYATQNIDEATNITALR
ncbi:hypothetical protein KNSL1_013611 [Colletotrichum chrysophilum]|nr:hypothetical protein KNSL1_013611 [Colletotrichum chrysophilum]